MTGLLGIVITFFTFMFPFEMIIVQKNAGILNNDGKNVIQQLGCYDNIDKKMLNKNVIFELKSNAPKICLIFLPENVVVNYKMINFSSEKNLNSQ
uniref:Uncharacterized protein n=1 Tax=Panagrolaimus superbus TaxID=310955 RepID=A0A914YPS7_9BILA